MRAGTFFVVYVEYNIMRSSLRIAALGLAALSPTVGADEATARAHLKELGAVIIRDERQLEAVSINLNVSKTTDADLGVLKEIKNIQTLFLRQTPITDAGLAELRGLIDLETLDLYRTRISD